MAKYHSLSKELQQQIQEDRKAHRVNPYAFREADALRRCPDHDRATLWRPAFVRDIEKIMHIPYYNRYSDKTQVFSLYRNDDISRRAQHVQLVSRIARNIGAVLGLNPDLIEAISLGHDIGHTPFGHAGERKLSELYHSQTSRYFNHNIHSACVLDRIFPLNLNLQTLDGIICHNGEIEKSRYEPQPYTDFGVYDDKVEQCYRNPEENKKLMPCTLEGCVMRIADIIAYLGKDRQDAIKLGLLEREEENSGTFLQDEIGGSNAEIINNMSVNLIENSYGKNYLSMDPAYFEALSKKKKENYALIYNNPKVDHIYREQINPMLEAVYFKLLEDVKKADRQSVIYRHHIEYINELTSFNRAKYGGSKVMPYEENEANAIVVDYIASMTDDYFIELYQRLFPEGKYRVDYVGYFSEEP